MEYAWGIAASKTPFPAEFVPAARSKLKDPSSSRPIPPQTVHASSTLTKGNASPPPSSSTRQHRPRIPGHSRPPSSSSSPGSRPRDQGCAEPMLVTMGSHSPGSNELLSRVSSHPTPSAPSALTQDERRRPASATIGGRFYRSRSRNSRISGKPEDQTGAHPRPASTSAAFTTFSSLPSALQDKQLPALPTEASTFSSSLSPRRLEICDAIDEYDNPGSASLEPLMSRASTLSHPDGGSHKGWRDHSVAASATAPPLSATSGPSSQHHRPPSLKPSSTAVCDASKKSKSPLSFSRSRAQIQIQHPLKSDNPATQKLVQIHELSRKPPNTPWGHAASSSTSTDPPDRRRDRRQSNHATMVGTESTVSSRTDSVAESISGRTIMSSEPPFREVDGSSTKSQSRPSRPFVTKSNGRTYLSDPTLAYPLPVDLHELHRQSLRTLLLFQLFGGPLCSPFFADKPPTRVLDVGCAYGFWSMMCHSYYSRKGFPNVHFTGLDIAALGGIAGMHHATGPHSGSKDRISTTSASGNWAEQPPDKNMRWNFVQHDLRQLPLPFADDEFDLIMCKDMSMAVPTTHFTPLIDEYMRILKPGGALEVWECDHPIRMLRPHVPDTPATGQAAATPNPDSSSATEGGENASAGVEDVSTTVTTPGAATSSKKGDYEKEVAELGAYVITNNTPLSGPQNNYLIEYNGWMSKYLEAHLLLAFPCANVGAMLIQEPLLTNCGSKRLAIPLSEVRWEREGVGGVVSKNGKSYIDTSKAIGKAAAALGSSGSGSGKRGSSATSAGGADGEDASGGSKKGKALSAGQLALRQTALQTVVQFIEGLEPALREVSGKKPDEWDTWMGKLMKELIERDGTSCGECLEVGAWWARKVSNP